MLVLELQPPGVFRPNSVFSGRVIDQPMVKSQAQVLASAHIVSQVIERLGLLGDPVFQVKTSGDAFWRLRRKPQLEPMNAAIEEFQKRLEVERIGTSNAIRISFRGEDPAKAALIANATAQIYIANQLAQKLDQFREKLPFEDRIIVTRAPHPQAVRLRREAPFITAPGCF